MATKSDFKFITSHCGKIILVSETIPCPLIGNALGSIPLDRRCLRSIYSKVYNAKAAVLLVPGFASNRACFDIGRGRGKSGPSFFEYIAIHGYDTYSMDLSGSRHSERLGCTSPAYIKQHIEIDVPSVIAAIKRKGHEKVYLIGHSLGGAISCAVAGNSPNDIGGIVHLAGLYHLTLPILRDILHVYELNTPMYIRSLVRNVASGIYKSVLYSLPVINRFLPLNSITNSSNSLISGIVRGLRRQKIPLRFVVDSFLYLRRFVTSEMEQSFLNKLYPSPWFPYSVEDPWTFIDVVAESPTIGVFLGVTTTSLKEEDYTKWLEDSSHNREEIRQITENAVTSALTLKKINQESTRSSIASNSTLVDNENPNRTLPNAKECMYSNINIESRNNAILMETLISASNSSAICDDNSGILLGDTESPSKSSLNKFDKKISDGFKSWNELSGYLEKFEQLQHLPLFFVPANADAIILTQDTLAGHIRSKSKWKHVIEYSSTEKATQLNEDSQLKRVTSMLPHTNKDLVSKISLKDPLKQTYQVPDRFKYGHCDILGGKHAEEVWEQIVAWLDVTTTRERDWRFKRRYSAK